MVSDRIRPNKETNPVHDRSYGGQLGKVSLTPSLQTTGTVCAACPGYGETAAGGGFGQALDGLAGLQDAA